MKGTMITLTPQGSVLRKDLDKTPDIDVLQATVGGSIEEVPGFKLYHHEGQNVDCVTFCNEEGKMKNLDINTRATSIWQRQYPVDDVLVGPVIVLFGDSEFMNEL